MMSAMVSSVGALGQAEAALGAALAAHDPRRAQLAEDVLEEVHRDLLRRGDPLGRDRLVVGGGRKLDGRTDRVVGLGGDPHRCPLR
jgi:hypothetical protein